MKNIAKTFESFIALVAFAFAATADEAPDVLSVTMSQDEPSRLVTISYELSSQPAVVTLDIETNIVVNGETVGWASIGARHFCDAEGDVWKKVEKTNGTITWHPERSWLKADGTGFKVNGATSKARARVTAWGLDLPPPYMVVDLATPSNVTWYASEDSLPGGLRENPLYKMTKLVMKRIDAAGVTFAMGTVSEIGRDGYENRHNVALTNNYYMGVFEVTRGQWAQFHSGRSNGFNVESAFRPMSNMGYSQIRWNSLSEEWGNDGTVADWPKKPRSNSFLGVLRKRTGLDFDIPSEAQWEYAARGGFGEGYWGDGSPILATGSDPNLDGLGRYRGNGGYPSESYPDNMGNTATNTWTSANGTAVVGSYRPNGYGLYDMSGNVWEFCLEFWNDSERSVHGEPMPMANNARYVARRGGAWNTPASYCRSSKRIGIGASPVEKNIYTGLRLCAPCEAR